MEDFVPLRDYMDQRFADHQTHVDTRFDTLERKVDGQGTHSHAGAVTWAGLLPVIAILITIMLAIR